MASQIANRAKGRFAEWAERVNANDPANSVFVLDLLATAGLETDAVLLDKDDFAALVAGTTDFATGTGWARKTFDQTGGLTVTYDDTNERVDVDLPDQTWTAVADAASDVSKIVFGYDSDSAAGTDANILFLSHHDWVIAPTGADVTATIAVFARAA